MSVRLRQRTPFLTVEIDLPWEIAELIVDSGAGIIKAIAVALERRKAELAFDQDAQVRIDARHDANKSQWADLAARCEAEIARRANGPGQRATIIRQLAAELKMHRPELERIIRVYRAQKQDQERKRQTADVIRLHLQGRSQRQIAAWLKVSQPTVVKILADKSDLVGRLRAAEAGSKEADGKVQP